jgi:hypothetical protein
MGEPSLLADVVQDGAEPGEAGRWVPTKAACLPKAPMDRPRALPEAGGLTAGYIGKWDPGDPGFMAARRTGAPPAVGLAISLASSPRRNGGPIAPPVPITRMPATPVPGIATHAG